MSAADDKLDSDIACIDFSTTPATLVSTHGTHCDVWRSMGYVIRDGRKTEMDFVIKQHNEACSAREILMLKKHYQQIRQELGLIIPRTLFVQTRVNNANSVIALAETVNVWFNLANPVNESELVPLLKKMPRPYDQLDLFVQYADEIYDEQGRIIDLYGMDNLVLDARRQVRYLDSFYIFFYDDMLSMVEEHDPLHHRVSVSRERLEYLKYVLRSAA